MTKITSVCNLNVMKEDAGMSDHLDIDGTIERELLGNKFPRIPARLLKDGEVTRYYGRAVTHFERFPYQFVKDVKKHLSVTDAETIIKILQNDIADGTIQ